MHWGEDVGDNLSKRLQEQKRDDKKVAGPKHHQAFTLGVLPGDTPRAFLPGLYQDREKGRLEWQAALGKLVKSGDETTRSKLHAALGSNGHVSFSGVGECEDERMRSIHLNVSDLLIMEISSPSFQREDTNLFHESAPTLKRGGNVIISADDTDLLLIGMLGMNVLGHGLSRTSAQGAEARLGSLFVKTTAQMVDNGSGGKFEEQFICCDEVGKCITAHPALSCIATEFRVPSVVAECIILGGDTTSYLYLPYSKSIGCFLEYAEFIGFLVRSPTEEEALQGWPICIDSDAVERLLMVLYASRNPTAIDRWTSLSMPERLSTLRNLRYVDMQKLVARTVFPMTMRFMPNLDLLRGHIGRAQLRLFQWMSAAEDKPPDVPLLGFVVILKNETGGSLRLQAPKDSEVRMRCTQGFTIHRVEPEISGTNTTIAELLGPEIPRDVLLRGCRQRKAASEDRAATKTAARAPLLAEARSRMQATPPKKLTVSLMVAVVVAFNASEGLSTKELMLLRKNMKGVKNATAEFDRFKASEEAKGTGIPWAKMGAPEEGMAADGQPLNEDAEVDSGSSDSDDSDSSEEDFEDEEEENHALDSLVDAVTTAVGEDAEEVLNAVADAPSSEETSALIMEGLRKRVSRAPVRMDV